MKWYSIFIENYDHSKVVKLNFQNDPEEWRTMSVMMLAILHKVVTCSSCQVVKNQILISLESSRMDYTAFCKRQKGLRTENASNPVAKKVLGTTSSKISLT
jgi:hypothetical protein